MIFDHIDHASLYAGLSPRLAAAFAFLAQDDASTIPAGRHEIDGDAVFALVQEYATRDSAPRRFETHRRYIDVQFMADGSERIGIGHPATLRVSEPYDPGKEAEFLTGEGADLALTKGQFMVLFPHEAHQPCLHPEGVSVPVRKIVVKVRIG